MDIDAERLADLFIAHIVTGRQGMRAESRELMAGADGDFGGRSGYVNEYQNLYLWLLMTTGGAGFSANGK
jgi:hypothetical protein